MSLFSQRKGYKPIKSAIQVESMDDDLRIGLWNALTIYYWDQVKSEYISSFGNEEIRILLSMLWQNYFKWPIDTLQNTFTPNHRVIREHFFSFKWYEVYDFIEFIVNNYPDKFTKVNLKFMDLCNHILERELSAYRFVGGKITQITSEGEVEEIEEALEASKPLKAVHTHLERALELLSDRKSPDYRNSIKESISAVESICNLITKEKNATLGQALKIIEDKVGLHHALKSAFSNLYGYTNDAKGIRHALLDETNLDFEDAKFMLVSCAAFINYLISKASKVGIEI